MADDYREMLVERSPAFLRTPGGEPFMHALGDAKDAQAFRFQEALYARFPRHAPTDALDALGVERQMPRTPGESNASYAERLIGAWEFWEDAGTARGLLNALWTAGYQNVHVAIANRRRYYLTALGVMQTVTLPASEWLFRRWGNAFWSEFLVIFVQPLIPRWMDDVIPDSTSDEAAQIRSIIRKWKPAHMTCAEIAIQTSARSLDFYPTGETLTTNTLGARLDVWPDWIHWQA